MTISNIRIICRYLNINPFDGHEVKLTGDHDDCLVKLCAKCSLLSDKLNQSIHQMEAANLVMDQQLQELQKIVNAPKKQNEEANSSDQFRREAVQNNLRRHPATVNSVEADVQELLRKRIQDISSQKQLQSPVINDSDVGSLNDGSSPETLKLNTPTEWTKKWESHLKIHIKRIRRNLINCPFCKDKLNGGLACLRKHLISLHPDEFFIQKMSPTLSEDIIRNNFKRILQAELAIKMKPLQSQQNSTGSLVPALCQICGSNQAYTGIASQGYHFVLNHYNILEEKFINSEAEGMKSPEKSVVHEILSNLCDERPGAKTIKRFFCGICKSLKYSFKSSVFTHLVFLHADKIFASRKLPDVSENDFQKFCSQVFEVETNEEEYIPCGFCGLKCFKLHIRKHLILEHYETLGERLLTIQERALTSANQDPSLRCIPGDQKIMEESVDESHEIEFATKPIEESEELDEINDQKMDELEDKPGPNCCEVIINAEKKELRYQDEYLEGKRKYDNMVGMMICEEDKPIIMKIDNANESSDNSVVVKTEAEPESILPNF